jgi:hypothetical protein
MEIERNTLRQITLGERKMYLKVVDIVLNMNIEAISD